MGLVIAKSKGKSKLKVVEEKSAKPRGNVKLQKKRAAKLQKLVRLLGLSKWASDPDLFAMMGNQSTNVAAMIMRGSLGRVIASYATGLNGRPLIQITYNTWHDGDEHKGNHSAIHALYETYQDALQGVQFIGKAIKADKGLGKPV